MAVHVLLVLCCTLLTDSINVLCDTVNIDLTTGIVRGYSPYISFIRSPNEDISGTETVHRCSRQSVVRIDFSGPYKLVRFLLDFDRPRLWTVDIADSPNADGHGGDAANSTSNSAEIHVFNRQLRVHSNSLPGFRSAAIDGGHLLKVVDDIARKGSHLILQVGNEKVSWSQGKQREELESKFLFTLAGQKPTHGKVDYNIYAGFNRIVGGNWRNGSGLCQATIILQREEDECILGTHECDVNAVCKNTRKSYRCHCKPGYEGDGKKCEDKNECKIRNGGCVHRCFNSPGNYSCGCFDGFQLDKDNHNCIDLNECLRKKGGCAHQCINTIGSYECRCNEGYTIDSDGRSCNAGSWCREQGCAHSCTATRTSYVCTCRPGYILAPDGKNCMETCLLGNGGCQHRCTNTPDGPVCICHYKYILGLDKKSCSPSCSINNGGCDRRCSTTPKGGVKCSCPTGLILHKDGKTCLDINECEVDNGGCSYKCQNSIGSYECLCPVGYKLLPDEKTCQEFDECTINGTCDHICINLPGSYECRCWNGFDRYGFTHCGDRNECAINNGGCQHLCINTEGSYQCACKEGYRLLPNQKDCVELDSCPSESPNKISLSCSKNQEQRQQCGIVCPLGSRFNHGNVPEIAQSYSYTCGSRHFESNNICTETGTDRLCSDSSSSSVFHRKVRFYFPAVKCHLLERKISSLTPGRKMRGACLPFGHLTYVSIECFPHHRLRRLHRSSPVVTLPTPPSKPKPSASIIKVEMEIKMNYPQPTTSCDRQCSRRKILRRFRQMLFTVRHRIRNESFFFIHEDRELIILKRAPQTLTPETSPICSEEEVYLQDTCMSCKAGSFYDLEQRQCRLCPPGTYYEGPIQFGCDICPLENGKIQGMEYGSRNISQCGNQCSPGFYSNDGFEPCIPCEVGTFQPEPGRTSCISCGVDTTTLSTASRYFTDCIIKETCLQGYYYNVSLKQCKICPRRTYQPDMNQFYCINCPGDTTTDIEGATSVSECKSTQCSGYTDKLQGLIESPNFPGNYPDNVECTWVIKPQKGRRILVVVPEIFIANDKCGDTLIMRKSRSPFSVSTYETCKTQDRPIAFSARSRKLWIHFKSDSKNNDRGFRIPYALYNEEYQPLIESIVRDSQLYAMINHQEILKDRKLLTALMDVIAYPINYYKYANISKAWFPDSFIRFIMSKVKVFFS